MNMVTASATRKPASTAPKKLLSINVDVLDNGYTVNSYFESTPLKGGRSSDMVEPNRPTRVGLKTPEEVGEYIVSCLQGKKPSSEGAAHEMSENSAYETGEHQSGEEDDDEVG